MWLHNYTIQNNCGGTSCTSNLLYMNQKLKPNKVIIILQFHLLLLALQPQHFMKLALDQLVCPRSINEIGS